LRSGHHKIKFKPVNQKRGGELFKEIENRIRVGKKKKKPELGAAEKSARGWFLKRKGKSNIRSAYQTRGKESSKRSRRVVNRGLNIKGMRGNKIYVCMGSPSEGGVLSTVGQRSRGAGKGHKALAQNGR